VTFGGRRRRGTRRARERPLEGRVGPGERADDARGELRGDDVEEREDVVLEARVVRRRRGGRRDGAEVAADAVAVERREVAEAVDLRKGGGVPAGRGRSVTCLAVTLSWPSQESTTTTSP
jgi:hypothetical protein